MECGDQVRDHGLGFRFRLGRKVFLGIVLADDITEKAVHHEDAALPTRALLLRSRQYLSHERKALVVECLGKHSAVLLDQVEGQPVFPGFERCRLHEGGFTRECLRLPYVEAVDVVQAGAAEIFFPIKARSLGGEVGALPDVVRFVDVLIFGQGSMGLRNRMLQFNDLPGAGFWIGEAGQFHHRGHMRLVLGANALHVLAFAKVVLTVRQLNAALHEIGKIMI